MWGVDPPCEGEGELVSFKNDGTAWSVAKVRLCYYGARPIKPVIYSAIVLYPFLPPILWMAAMFAIGATLAWFGKRYEDLSWDCRRAECQMKWVYGSIYPEMQQSKEYQEWIRQDWDGRWSWSLNPLGYDDLSLLACCIWEYLVGKEVTGYEFLARISGEYTEGWRRMVRDIQTDYIVWVWDYALDGYVKHYMDSVSVSVDERMRRWDALVDELEKKARSTDETTRKRQRNRIRIFVEKIVVPEQPPLVREDEPPDRGIIDENCIDDGLATTRLGRVLGWPKPVKRKD